jgi:ribose/xylose/arabinose/galactoside ABC-type transport system permease subunit
MRGSLQLLDQYGIIPLLFVILFVFFALSSNRFATIENLSNLGRQATILMIATMGQSLYLITKNFDLSVGATVALTSVVMAIVMTWSGFHNNTTLAITCGILAAIGVGLAIGLVNGLAIALGLSSFMITLAVASIAYGLALIFSNGAPVTGVPASFTGVLGFDDWFGVPVPIVCTLALLAVFYVLLNRLVMGRYAFAIGGNREAARISGIPVRVTTIKLLMIGSVLAALAGIVLTARVGTGEANLGGDFPLLTIAAAVLGGVSLAGGVGRLSGMVIAVVFIQMISNGLDLIRVQSYVEQIVFGVLLIFAIGVDHLRAHLAARG